MITELIKANLISPPNVIKSLSSTKHNNELHRYLGAPVYQQSYKQQSEYNKVQKLYPNEWIIDWHLIKYFKYHAIIKTLPYKSDCFAPITYGEPFLCLLPDIDGTELFYAPFYIGDLPDDVLQKCIKTKSENITIHSNYPLPINHKHTSCNTKESVIIGWLDDPCIEMGFFRKLTMNYIRKESKGIVLAIINEMKNSIPLKGQGIFHLDKEW